MPNPPDASPQERRDAEQSETLSVWQVARSILAAAFGVQSEEARRRDFSRGKPSHFIIGGIVFTVIFVLLLVTIVRLVLHSAGV